MTFPACARVVAIGNSSVGKTSIISTLTGDSFNVTELPTVGANWRLFSHSVGTELVRMQIWDTAGQERYRALGPLYFRDAAAAVVVFDITSLDSWKGVPSWVESVVSVAGPEVAVFIVGNKVDRSEDRVISTAEAQAWAVGREYEYFETSARTGQGVRALFETVAERVAGHTRKTSPRLQERERGCC
jgi:small GTP-binding protein